jgi:L-ascorbate metabolism protein UlaG (beta-lactamase superfamily)
MKEVRPITAQNETVQVWYLAHSAWLVETSQRLLLFDYGSRPARPACGHLAMTKLAEAKLAMGCLDLADLPAKPLLAFSSHRHGDHYDPALHAKLLTQAGLKCEYFLGLDAADPEPAQLPPGTVTLRPEQHLVRDDLEIRTAISTDQGIAFLLRLPELTLYYGGDLAVWDETPFYREQHAQSIDLLAKAGWSVDLAFIPVSTSDGYQEAPLLAGAMATVRQLRPRWVFPMHAHGFEYFYQRFANWLAENEPAFNGKVLVQHQPGDTFLIDLTPRQA